MYCSKNVVNQSLGLNNYCDGAHGDGIDNTCVLCSNHCIDKNELTTKVYFIIQSKEYDSKKINKINGYIKLLD